MYYVTRLESNEITVGDFLEKYVDVEKFINFCYSCENYNNHWSCPPFDFDSIELWKSYKLLKLYGIKINLDEELINREYNQNELSDIYKNILINERQKFDPFLLNLESNMANSLALTAGNCIECGFKSCSRRENKACLHPDKMRHSIESLGGDVSKISEDLLKLEIKWIKDGKLPEYLTLVGGLLF